MEVTAKYDYESAAADELSFRKGDRLKILQTNGNWYKAEVNGCKGLVPKNFICLPSWYQEDSSRNDAQQKLMQQPVGAFILRGSRPAAESHFAISVRCAADVQHFKVLQDSRGQYYLWLEKFSSLNQLVEHYKNNSISKQSPVFLQEQQQHKSSSTLQVRALHSFHAEETDELEFNAGDIITVLENSERSWWKGQLRGQTGLFPSSYTKPI